MTTVASPGIADLVCAISLLSGQLLTSFVLFSLPEELFQNGRRLLYLCIHGSPEGTGDGHPQKYRPTNNSWELMEKCPSSFLLDEIILPYGLCSFSILSPGDEALVLTMWMA